MFEFTSKAKSFAYILILVGVIAWVAGYFMNSSQSHESADDEHHIEAVANHGDDHASTADNHIEASHSEHAEASEGHGQLCS
jgi:hypothetical protein